MQSPEPLAVLHQLLVADGEQRPLERGVHRQLVVRPLHRRQRRAQALDFFAQVEGAAADQQMGDAARLQRLDVVTRDVLAPRGEAPEQQAHVSRRDRQGLAGPLALGDLPSALVQQPGDERAHGPGQRCLHGVLRQFVAPPVRLGDRQRHDARLAGDAIAVRGQRHVRRPGARRGRRSSPARTPRSRGSGSRGSRGSSSSGRRTPRRRRPADPSPPGRCRRPRGGTGRSTAWGRRR